MKRLKNCLLQVENNTKTFRQLYEGKIIVPPDEDSDPTFWYGDISVTVEHTNREAFDLPTLLWKIPVTMLGVETYSTAVADYCYRQLKPYIDGLNSEIYNRNKPKNETGWYYLAELGGEILERNSAFFRMAPAKAYVNRNGFVISYLPGEQTSPERMCFCFRMQVQLTPKRIQKVISMLCSDLPSAISSYIAEFDRTKLSEVEELSKLQRCS